MGTKKENWAITARSPKQLGHAIHRFRTKEGFTQCDVAERSGTRQGTVSALETGKTAVRLETLFKIAAALDLEVTVRKRQKGHIIGKNHE